MKPAYITTLLAVSAASALPLLCCAGLTIAARSAEFQPIPHSPLRNLLLFALIVSIPLHFVLPMLAASVAAKRSPLPMHPSIWLACAVLWLGLSMLAAVGMFTAGYQPFDVLD